MSFYSSYWYRVTDITPRLRSHTRLFKHVYRGQNWYILQDPSSSRQHRFNATTYFVIGLMNGKRTVHEIWDAVSAALGDEAPSQDDIIHLLSQLHSVDVLQCDIPPDTLEMFQRQNTHGNKWKRRLINPLALQFPLFDPDIFLVRWLKLIRPFVGLAGTLLWLLIVGLALILTVLNWPELTNNMADRVLNPKNILILWLVYPVVKLLHELGHAFATRIWGGEVHEVGIMLLALTPIPYVEASASAAFPDKYKRMAVAGAGMAVELLVASLALFVWLSVEDGMISSIAYNVLLVSGISTILFNGNPLLRFDGYYVLVDWIEIPNLGRRSTRYLGYLLQHYIFGIEGAVSPVTAKGERVWFVTYGITAFFYRLLVLATLAFFISSKYYFVGVLIVIWAICVQIILPAARHSYRVYNSGGGRRKRTRIITVSMSISVALMILLFALPVPLRTRVEGVVSLPEHSRVRAGTDCVITEILVQDGTIAQSGESLLRCEDPYLDAEVKVFEANLAESRARYNAEPLKSRVQRKLLKKEVALVEADLAHYRNRMNELTIRSPNQGIFVLPESQNILGRFVEHGALLGYIVGSSEATVIVVVSQSDIGLVREKTKAVELRLAGNLDMPFATSIEREIPAASNYLPSPVLGTLGGGNNTVDPTDQKGLKTLKKTFQFGLDLPIHKEQVRIGERAYALFDHGYEPIGLQWYRSLRQLFLRRFYV